MIYVTIPKGCMNLAASVNVILYDRLAKQLRRWRQAGEDPSR
ncbi:RNA methyltransferase [Aeromonas dhakensis]|nr:RNA methyltransferase [Aeromonas dhakensis]MBW3730090.1 RNA methyltransferase [Aeromonas dhakensis]QSR54803.1 RNA methyltransferase [Aeromonas dhakensis]